MKKIFINLKKYSEIINIGFFTAKGGISKGVYSSLNCGKSTKDKKNDIYKNINIAIKSLNIENKKLKLINQIHSNKVFTIAKKNFEKKFYGDGLITKDKNISLGVLTADCAPIFIFDRNKKIICCVHSGWKGALSNIVQKSVKKLKEKNITTYNIIAVVGPCLGFKNFEVDRHFKKKIH